MVKYKISGLFLMAIAVILSSKANAFDPIHMEQLITERKCINCDLRDAYFDKINLSGIDVTGTNFSGSFFYRVNMRGAILNHTDLSNSFFDQTNLSWTNLSDAIFTDAFVTRTNMHGANLTNTDFGNTVLPQVNKLRSFDCNPSFWTKFFKAKTSCQPTGKKPNHHYSGGVQ